MQIFKCTDKTFCLRHKRPGEGVCEKRIRVAMNLFERRIGDLLERPALKVRHDIVACAIEDVVEYDDAAEKRDQEKELTREILTNRRICRDHIDQMLIDERSENIGEDHAGAIEQKDKHEGDLVLFDRRKIVA